MTAPTSPLGQNDASITVVSDADGSVTPANKNMSDPAPGSVIQMPTEGVNAADSDANALKTDAGIVNTTHQETPVGMAYEANENFASLTNSSLDSTQVVGYDSSLNGNNVSGAANISENGIASADGMGTAALHQPLDVSGKGFPMANKEPMIIRGKDEMRAWSRSVRARGKSIGFVPTMGYLHEGHLSLIEESQKHTDVTVVSIYVNPGQFSPNEDLSTYPSDFLGDIQKLKNVAGGVDVVFYPQNLYDYGVDNKVKDNDQLEGKVVSCVENSGMGHETWIRAEKLEKGLCGNSRPVFFRGVATIVAKLFNIVEPDVAVFGKKDYQQWRIIQRMVRDLDFGIKIVGADLVRDDDGLAKSSRNVRLSSQEREKALSISKSLFNTKTVAKKGQVNCRVLKDSVIQAIHEAGGKVDYAEIVDQESLEAIEEIKRPAVFCVAAWFGDVRLIDNMEIGV